MKILMVCLGNICRSPLAHGVLEHMAIEQGLNWEVDSAGTGNWHVGQGPDRRSVRTAREHGVDISKQICRQFKTSDFDEFDHIFVMDKNNLSDVLAQARNKADEQKVKLLLGNKIVPDPYYDDSQFEPVYTMIAAACKNIVKQLA
jgi:protein-tyrosine phosphatase